MYYRINLEPIGKYHKKPLKKNLKIRCHFTLKMSLGKALTRGLNGVYCGHFQGTAYFSTGVLNNTTNIAGKFLDNQFIIF